MSGSYKMRRFILICLAFPILGAAAVFFFGEQELFPEKSQWQRQDQATVVMQGLIEPGELNKFKAVFDEKVKRLIVDSAGGSVRDALQIAMILKNAGVAVTVRGKCLSSCANYLFTAGKERIIDEGIVGFHGNASALAAATGGVGQIVSAATPFWTKLFLSEEAKKDMRAQIKQTLRWEKSFFSSLGISQELFNRTQLPDKGKRDGKQYAFLLPAPATFARYGLGNVRGTQSLKVKEAFEQKFSILLLHE